MQFMVNADTDPTSQLRAIAVLLVEAADARDGQSPPEGFRTDEQILSDISADVLGADAAAIFGKTTAPAAPPAASIVAPPPAAAAPPPAASIVAPPPAATTTEPVDGERDSKGQLYDPNVHSSSRAKVADGTWKKRRGGAAKTTAAPPPATTEPARLPSSASVAGNDQVGATVAAVAPPPAAAAPPPPATPPPADASVPTFRSVVKKATDAQQAGKLTAEAILALVKSAGAPDLQTLNAMAHLVPQVDALLDAALIGK